MYQYKTLTILLLFPFLLHAQGKNDYVWMMGRGTSNNPEIHSGGTMIDFNSGQAVPSFFPLPYQFGFDIPCSISDDNGKLQFYTNGCRIINFEHEQVANGDGLSPTELSECNVYPYGFDGYQDMLILPKPGHPGKYVYLHHTYDRWYEQSAVLYSEIDMNANGGKGKVIVKNRLIKDFVEIEGAYAAVRHGNGRDWWIFIPEAKACIYRSWLLTPDTLVGPFLQNWENDLAAQDPGKTCWNGLFSPDGRLFAHVTLSNGYNRIFLYDFDRCSGRLCNPRIIRIEDPYAYASHAVFSPNSRFLYFQIAQSKLYQFDLQTENIEASRVLVGEYDGFKTVNGFPTTFHMMCLAPDNKIYMGTTSGTYFLHTIHSPNETGLACDFRQHDLQIPTVKDVVMPNHPNYRLYDLPGSICDTIGIDSPYPVEQFITDNPKPWLSPNPACCFTTLHFPQPFTAGTCIIFNLLGQIVYQHNLQEGADSLDIRVEHLPPGSYLVSVERPGEKAWTGKLIVLADRF